MRVSNCTCVPARGSMATESSAQSALQNLESVQDTLRTIHTLAGILKYVWKRSPAMAMGVDAEERRIMEDIKAALLKLMEYTQRECGDLAPRSSDPEDAEIPEESETGTRNAATNRPQSNRRLDENKTFLSGGGLNVHLRL